MKKNFAKLGIDMHKKLHGKISVVSKKPIKTLDDLSILYTPGVGAASSYLAVHKSELRRMTIKNNTVAVVSDGSAVLGLGNIGAAAAIPVMEGKCVLFKEFAGIDAFPIVLDTQNPDEIVETIKNIAPVFGGINLEDISAPRCFEIEERLQNLLDIPLMHDDQHGTAIVVIAGLINAFKVADKRISESKIVIVGAGAAGNAVAKLLHQIGAGDIIVTDSKGIIDRDRKNLDPYKKHLAEITNRKNLCGNILAASEGADAIIGLSKPGSINASHIKSMAEKPIVFALANPVPEILPQTAKKAGAYIVATGRSDFPNQINNVLGFPGIFRGALDHKVKKITPEIKLAAAKKLASLVKNPSPTNIIPSVLDRRVAKAVASVVR
ncbi:MAG: malate dehydrogenase [Candidatus Portnoybacteria bacterium RBG_19FT_COMBO_36_7]|uniref:Malate dehydrogenase n=1 Tax=Candidatus Portnoybacteria bacterium RBG_19FT_COMBO_36_7 TaxID=1801992 RepID=A0A1G2F9T8_9BACT|nr:MAG: malate dehydrogenase [Candidatus Portnoybacteria bacterium RBG_19FT_COMBO_36_7]